MMRYSSSRASMDSVEVLLTLRVTVIIVASPHVVLRPPVEPELGAEGRKRGQ